MRALPIAAIAAALVLSLSACSDDSEGDAAACKKAIQEQIKEGSLAKDKPAACEGLDDKTLERIADDLVGDIKMPTPEIPTPDIDVPTPELDLPEVP